MNCRSKTFILAALHTVNDSIRIVVVCNQNLVRKSLCMLLATIPGIAVVGEAADAAEALNAAEAFQPDIVLLDNANDRSIQLIAELAAREPKVRVVMLSMNSEWEYVREALAAGASSYVLKDSSKTELELSIRSAAVGGLYLCAAVAKHIAAFLRSGGDQAPERSRLTERQKQILRMLAEGHSVKEIAYALKLSPKTVETHRARLMERLEIYDIPTLVRYAIHKKLVKAE